MSLPSKVTIKEVGPRDGLQIEPMVMPTANKVQLINALAHAGIKRIEAVSFFHPRLVPQMADAEQVMAEIERVPGTEYEGLVSNVKGAERALAAKVDILELVICATESFNRANLNRTINESLEELPIMVGMGHKAGMRVLAGMAAATGCPFEGQVPVDKVLWMSDQLVGMGVDELDMSDTIGCSDPVHVGKLAGLLLDRHPEIPLDIHLHDTRGMGLANILACLQVGATLFDSSVGGIGGCPFAPGAAGNICTIELVHMLHLMDIETGIDLDALVEVGKMTRKFVGHELPSRVLKAGKSYVCHPLPAPQTKKV